MTNRVFRFQLSNSLTRRRASSPPCTPVEATGRLLPSSTPPKGACGTHGRFAASAAPLAVERSSWLRASPNKMHGGVCPRGSHDPAGPNNPRDGRRRRKPPAFRTRMDFAACCMSPGIVPFVDTPPGSNGLPPGHALGPSARSPLRAFALRRACAPAFVAFTPTPPERSIRKARAFRPGIVAATATRSTT
jgi:hypothetical protein